DWTADLAGCAGNALGWIFFSISACICLKPEYTLDSLRNRRGVLLRRDQRHAASSETRSEERIPPMSASKYVPRIGIYGPDDEANQPSRGCNLWPAGYAASVAAAEGTAVLLEMPAPGQAWDEVLADLDGIVFLGQVNPKPRAAANEERLCHWCRERELPF